MDPSRGRPDQRGRTRRALLEAAARLIAAGQTPTTTEVADAADVSRRTAYRYFPSADELWFEAAEMAISFAPALVLAGWLSVPCRC